MKGLSILALLVALGACTRVGTAGDTAGGTGRHPWTVPDTLRVALPGNINTMNPLLTTQQVETVTETFAFDPLVATDPEGRDVVARKRRPRERPWRRGRRRKAR